MGASVPPVDVLRARDVRTLVDFVFKLRDASSSREADDVVTDNLLTAIDAAERLHVPLSVSGL